MKTYYELLTVEPTADTSTIKTAFRREIARYHPDKVIHLGPEFQEMAATRAAELTGAYKTLTDKGLRAEYDARLAQGLPPPPMVAAPRSPNAPAAAPRASAEDSPDFQTPPPPLGRARFETERAGRDVILRRAMTVRVQGVVESLYGPLQTPTVRGFDVAFVPTAKPRLLGATLPRVLVKVVDTVDAAAAKEGWSNASRSRVHSGKSPIVVLLFGKHISPPHDLLRALQALDRQPKPPDSPHEIAVVAIDTSDWTCHMPPDVSAPVRKLVDKICK